MKKIEVVLKNGKYGIIEDGIEIVPFVHHTDKEAIEEWACFEKINTMTEPHLRFLNHITSFEKINEIVDSYNI
jgi:hypothetical protein